MKPIILINLLLLLMITASAQLSIERQVIGSSGSKLQFGNLSQDFTIGEPVIATFNNIDLVLSQGFHQGNLGPANSLQPLLEPGELTIYPQPAQTVLFIRLATSFPTALRIEVYDLLGRQMLGKRNALPAHQSEMQLEIRELNAGAYILRLTDAHGRLIGSRKWLKL
ncbi:MAG: T9SS type A sorting domain-containing protein [Bacteroidota bacterium]